LYGRRIERVEQNLPDVSTFSLAGIRKIGLSLSEPLRIVYFGTPGYAVPTLRALASDPRFDVVLVVTQPDRRAVRSSRLVPPIVKVEADLLGLSVYQPESLRTEATRAPLVDAGADLFVVAAYGLVFGSKTLAIPRLGCLNLHASLLPAYRGASPISAAILNGDGQTGVTLMLMEQGLDTGPMIASGWIDIGPSDTTESLTPRLAELGAELALESIPGYVSGELPPVPQPNEGASLVRPLLKADGQLDWRKPAAELERQVRAMWPWPRAWFALGDDSVQVHSARVVEDAASDPGAVENRIGRVVVACSNGGLQLDLVQLPGGTPVRGRQLAASGRLVPGQKLALPIYSNDLTPMIRPVE